MVFQPEIVLFWDTRKSVKIKRPLRIKAAAKVYEPEWEVYFEHRQQEKMVGKFVGRNLLSYLYRRQAGKCAHCHPAITTETGWDRHHRHPKPRGGKNSDDTCCCCTPTATNPYTTRVGYWSDHLRVAAAPGRKGDRWCKRSSRMRRESPVRFSKGSGSDRGGVLLCLLDKMPKPTRKARRAARAYMQPFGGKKK